LTYEDGIVPEQLDMLQEIERTIKEQGRVEEHSWLKVINSSIFQSNKSFIFRDMNRLELFSFEQYRHNAKKALERLCQQQRVDELQVFRWLTKIEEDSIDSSNESHFDWETELTPWIRLSNQIFYDIFGSNFSQMNALQTMYKQLRSFHILYYERKQSDSMSTMTKPLQKPMKPFIADTQSIRDAVRLWCTRRLEALRKYKDISRWDTSRVTDMSGLFLDRNKDDISGWDVSNVTNMSNMFSAATSFNQPLNRWNTGKVKDMSRMFCNAKAFNQPLDQWNLESVTDMSMMFCGAVCFNQPLNPWNVHNVINIYDNDVSSCTLFQSASRCLECQ
jgi:hypothetical protein